VTITDIALDRIEDHPHNVRRRLGDLTELTKSIDGQGIRLPVTVLPADENGVHRLVDGHRRIAAGKKTRAKEPAPCIIRDLSEVEVIELMLTTGLSAAELTSVEEARGYAYLVELDTTVSAIARKVGRSVNHVKGRLALTVLPDEILELVEERHITLDQAGQLVVHADDDEAIEWVVATVVKARLNRGSTANLVSQVVQHVRDRDRKAALDAEEAKLDEKGIARFKAPSSYWWVPTFLRIDRPATVKLLGLDTADARRHVNEPCHAVHLDIDTTSTEPKVVRTTMCVDPLRHTPDGPEGHRSDLQIPNWKGEPGTTLSAADIEARARRDASHQAEGCRAEFARHLVRTAPLDAPELVKRHLMVDTNVSGLSDRLLELLGESPSTDDPSRSGWYDAAEEIYEKALDDSDAWPRWIWGSVFVAAEAEANYDPPSGFFAAYVGHLIDAGYTPTDWDREAIARAAAAAEAPPDMDAMELSDQALDALRDLAASWAKEGAMLVAQFDDDIVEDLNLRGLVVTEFTPCGPVVNLTELGEKIAVELQARAEAS